VQDVCLELGLTSPTAVVSSTDQTNKQLLALMNRVGNMLYTEADWQALTKEHRFETVYYQYTGDTTAGSSTISNLSSVVGLSTDFMCSGTGIPTNNSIASVGASSVVLNVAATETATGSTFTFGQVKYAMPADFGRIVNKTQYQDFWEVTGPRSSQEWQAIKTGSGGTFMSFRIMGGKFTVWPMPTSGLPVGFEYVSKYWALSSASVAKEKFTADDDTCLFPENLIILGTKLKFFEVKGFDTTTLLSDFAREVSKYKGAESGAKTVNMARQVNYPMPSVPDTGYGS
jgi:hypothetical protein